MALPTAFFAVTLLVAGASVTPDAAAHFAHAQKLYDTLHFREAIDELKNASRLPMASSEQDIEIQVLLARAYLAERRPAEAEGAFEQALRRRPELELDPSFSPKVLKLFHQTKERLFPKDLVTLNLVFPSKEEINVELVDPWHRVGAVVLWVKPSSSDADWKLVPLSRRGEVFTYTFNPSLPVEQLWYVEALGKGGESVARAPSSANQPHLYRPSSAAIVQGVPAAALPGPTSLPAPIRRESSFHARDLQWVAVGAAIVAAGAGTFFQIQSHNAQKASQREKWVDAARQQHATAVDEARWATGFFIGAGVSAAAAGIFFLW